MGRKNILVGFSNTLAGGRPRSRCVNQNNTNFIRSVTHAVVSLWNETSASGNCTGRFLQNKSPSLAHIMHLLEKENINVILTILREQPKSPLT